MTLSDGMRQVHFVVFGCSPNKTSFRRGLMMQEMQREMQNIIVRHQSEIERLNEQQQEQLQLASVFDAPNLAQNVAPSPPPPDNKSKQQIADLQDQVKALQDKVQSQEGKMKSQDDKIQSQASSLITLEASLSSSNSSLVALKNSLATSEAEASTLKATLSSTSQELQTLTVTHESVARQLSDLRANHSEVLEVRYIDKTRSEAWKRLRTQCAVSLAAGK